MDNFSNRRLGWRVRITDVYVSMYLCLLCVWTYVSMYVYNTGYNRRKFRSQTSDNMGRWIAGMGRGSLDTWTGKIAKRIGTRPSALHSTFHFWRKSRRIASFLMLSTSKNEEGSQNCFVLTLSSSKIEDVSQNCFVFPQSVWAQGSSNSGGLQLIFSSSHLLIFTPSLTSSHLHTFSHIFSSSHLLIFTPSLISSHLHTFSSSHLLIFTSSHLHICSSSHLLIFTSSYLHIFSSSHLLIFTSLSSHTHTFSFSLSLFLSLSLSLSLLFPLSFLSLLSLSLFSLSPSLSFSL